MIAAYILCLFIAAVATLSYRTIVADNPCKQTRGTYSFRKYGLLDRPYTHEEVAKLKQYAVLFSIDNDTIEDTEELLRMGRKVEDVLGEESVDELVGHIIEYENSITELVIEDHLNTSHTVVRLVRKTKLLAKVSHEIISIDKMKEENGDEFKTIQAC